MSYSDEELVVGLNEEEDEEKALTEEIFGDEDLEDSFEDDEFNFGEDLDKSTDFEEFEDLNSEDFEDGNY
jgi:hypothetical protein